MPGGKLRPPISETPVQNNNINSKLPIRTKNQKSHLVLTVQAFCEEKGLRSLSGIFGYAESKNQCWQVEKWLFIDLICIFSR